MKLASGHIDILVNNAGIVTGKSFLECRDDQVEKTMDVNVCAHFWVSLKALRHLSLYSCTMEVSSQFPLFTGSES